MTTIQLIATISMATFAAYLLAGMGVWQYAERHDFEGDTHKLVWKWPPVVLFASLLYILVMLPVVDAVE